jgi:hypothetical protein
MAFRRSVLGILLLGLLVASVTLAFGGPIVEVRPPGTETPGSNAEATTTTSFTPEPSTTATEDPTEATITIFDADGETLGTIQARVADDPQERFTGLSDTTSLAPNEGMLFVFEREDDRAFVMRDMDFPLDIVFVDADGHITDIAHAPVENDTPLTRYTGRAKWVVEVNRGWTTDHDVSVGDEVRIDLR